MDSQSSRASLSSRLDSANLIDSTLTTDEYMWKRSSRSYVSSLYIEAINIIHLGSLSSWRSIYQVNIIWRDQDLICTMMLWSQCALLKCCNDDFRYHLLSSIFFVPSSIIYSTVFFVSCLVPPYSPTHNTIDAYIVSPHTRTSHLINHAASFMFHKI